MRPPALILQAPGSNRDRAAARALDMAGAAPMLMTLDALIESPQRLSEARFLLLPGGFSFGDDLGAGRLWAATLRDRLAEPLARFVEAGRPVMGICNGFQALVKLGLLPGDGARFEQTATLTHNVSARFECRWVRLQPQPDSPCVFTAGLERPIDCPVAHGEGRFVATGDTRARIAADGLAALRYVGDAYPANPNGSIDGIAGVCNAQGNVLGLMPHPEDHVLTEQHPLWRREDADIGALGLTLFKRGVAYARDLG